MRPIDGIIFDWGNVLGRFNHEKVHEHLSKHCWGTPKQIRDVIKEPARRHESGLSSQDFYAEVMKALNLAKMSYEDFHVLWRSCILGDNPGIAKVLKGIRPSISICILSNTDPIHWEAIGELPVVKTFFEESRIVRSYDSGVKVRKPDPWIYEAALRRLGLTPQEAHRALFIDDIAENCDAFRRIGGRAHQYNLNTDPITMLTAELRRLNALQ